MQAEILSKYLDSSLRLIQSEKVKQALKHIEEQVDEAMQEQVELCEIESPSFHEERRAQRVLDKMKEIGLTDVHLDAAGNAIGVRKGVEGGPVLAIGAHMDSVFPFGTDVKVRKDGNVYWAPGIGDNCSGLRALLQVARSLNHSDIQTQGTILFVGTVGEEGNGDLKGSKFFCENNQIDGFLAIDSTDVGRVLRGAVGSHRWKITISGPGGHSYAEFSKSPSAIHAMCRAGAEIADIEVPSDPKTTFTIGTIKGGSTVNAIAAEAVVQVDIRSVSNEELLKAETKILEAFEKGVKKENSRWAISDTVKKLVLIKERIGNRPAGMRPADCPVVQSALASQKVLGIELTNHGASSTDANAPMSKNIPSTCISSGGKGIGAHTLKEHFIMHQTHLGPQLALLTALNLVGTEGVEALLPKLS